MKVLVVIGDARERKRFTAMLSAQHYEVAEAATAAAAAGMLGQKFEIAFVDAGLVGCLRRASERVYVISVVGANATPSDYWASFSASADDVMRINASKEELLGRAGALERIRSWAMPQPSPLDRLSALAMWHRIEEIVATDLGSLIGDAFMASTYACPPVVFASEISLTFTAARVQLRFGLGIDATTMTALQQTLLGGDTTPDALADAMRELANTAAGAIKRAALDCGAELSVGLPSNTNILDLPEADRREWTLRGASGVSFACVTLVSSSQPKVVPARELREGMILARDVRNDIGILIAPAGTSLTRTTVEQLSRLLGQTATFEVDVVAA